jgi:hypothetical protein
MKSPAQRAAKRQARESRGAKRSTWYCSHCRGRHPLNERCPIPRRAPPPTILDPGFGDPFGGLNVAVLAAVAAADRGRK